MSVQEAEELVEEAAVEEAEAEEEQQEAPKTDPKLEDRAKRMGWVPKEKYRGPEESWRSAEEFIAHGEAELPILRERNRKLDETVVGLTTKLDDLEATMKAFAEFSSKAEQRAQERALKQLREEQRKAVEEGDTAAYDRIDKEIDTLAKDVTPPPEVSEKKPRPEEDPTFKSWSGENSWYDTDMVLAGFADNTAAPFIARTRPDLKGRAFYDAVAEAVKERFPEKFTNTRRAKPSAVEGAGEMAERKSGKKGYADLPLDAKKECDRFVKTIPDFTKEQYVKDYEWE